MQTLSYFEKTISPEQNATIEIVDPVEGNIHLTLEMVNEDGSENDFARYEVIDAHSAKISIINAQPDKYLAIYEPIAIGTYGGEYKLTANLKLTPTSQEGTRKIKIVFFISKKGE